MFSSLQAVESIEPEPWGDREPSLTRPWWLEYEVLLLLLLVLGIYFSRLTDLSIRGEEPRRATIAWEMFRTGDWIVPRQQGEPFLSRPPLGNWLIALTALARGESDLAAVRLPTVLATLLTTLLIYGYSRTFLSRIGAFASAAAYATMIQVLELGRLAETESVFTLLLGGSLLIWHWGYSRSWGPGWVWLTGYLLAALATLAKGPQAPVYFAASVTIFLVLTGRWRYLFSWGHLLGLFVFGLVVGTWQLLFWREVGWEAVRDIWAGDTAMRFSDTSWRTIFLHLVTYPLEILACTMPWSLLLFAYLSPSFRRSLAGVRGPVLFLAVCLAVTFPTCWLVPGARTRYYMPLYPCLAPLIGLVIQRCTEPLALIGLSKVWKGYCLVLGGVMVLAGVSVAFVSLGSFPKLVSLAQPVTFAVAYLAATVILAGLIVWACRGTERWRGELTILVVAGFMGLTSTGVVLNFQAGKSVDTEGEVARLKEKLPPGQVLVSLGSVHHCFVYHYRDLVVPLAWPGGSSTLDENVEFFCFNRWGNQAPPLPFEWEELGTVCVDRYRSPHPAALVVVGKRVRAPYGSDEATH